jgi:hypothetical protein
MPLITEDTPLGTHIKLIGNYDFDDGYKECAKCGEKTAFKSKSRWELYSPRFEGLCQECYRKVLNENLTEEDIKYFAEDYLDNGYFSQAQRDITKENFSKFIEPVVEEIRKEREIQEKERYHQSKLAEAQKIIDDIDKKGTLSLKDREKEIIASLLEKMDELIEDQSYRPEPIFR